MGKRYPYPGVALICFLVLALAAIMYFGAQNDKKVQAKIDESIRAAKIADTKTNAEEDANIAEAQTIKVMGHGHTIKYSPMGDSITAGSFATTEQNDFVHKLSTSLIKKMGFSVTTFAAGNYGGLLSTGLKGLNGVNSQNPNLITIEFGSVDCNTQHQVDPKIFETELNNLIDGLTVKVERDPIIVLVTTWNQGPMGVPFDQVITKVGNERHIPVANVEPIWSNPTNKGPESSTTFNGPSDAFHPNDYGHEAIAEAIYQQIKPILIERIKQGKL
ncbi:SGNH/GDSL hydrolase family protein [Desulfosporosinus sp. FKA]|uniref:SGNH/GDSL hydrolase family protein n=1 Tax=Desulfosporosinus sp. FKA TaxID=1969834 RepID=UPI001124E8D7|nr:SGNH/GDSL hydrolase family protein [Desulfosporosinus sp. FKA]